MNKTNESRRSVHETSGNTLIHIREVPVRVIYVSNFCVPSGEMATAFSHFFFLHSQPFHTPFNVTSSQWL